MEHEGKGRGQEQVTLLDPRDDIRVIDDMRPTDGPVEAFGTCHDPGF
jgi:hypothetical protein